MKKQSALLIITMLASSMSAQIHTHTEQTHAVQRFSSSDVHIEESEMMRRQQWDEHYILSLNADRLLFHFRQECGLEPLPDIAPYQGWESTDLRGHTLGHWLSALSLMAGGQASSNAIKEEAVKRLNHTIDVLAECQQQRSQLHPESAGYLSAFREQMLDVADNTGQGWAPYYTLHKILQGLLDAYRIGGNTKAIDIARRLGDYIYLRTTRLDKDKWLKALDIMEVGGFAESMFNLYQITNNSKHLTAAQTFQQMSKLAPAAHGVDSLHIHVTDNYNHANSTIPQFIAAKREYDINGNSMMLDAATNFWNMVVEHRTYCNGTTGFHEHWNMAGDQLSKELDAQAGENCCTYNMIKLSDELFLTNPSTKYPEYTERTIINGIMGTIEPETANFMYFHTQKPGAFKTFPPNDGVFYCCSASGMESHLRYAAGIYFHTDDILYVNQFFHSALQWQQKGVVLRQTTNFPCEEETAISFDEADTTFELRIRIPSWCQKGFTLRLNGKKATWTQRDGYACIRRKWHKGDKLSVSLPMSLHVEPLADAPQTVALLYGPIVLAADLGKDGVTRELINTSDNFFGGVKEPWQVNMQIPSLTGNVSNLNWIKKQKNKLLFSTSSTSDGSTILFRPLYEIHDCRFADYMKVVSGK